MAGGSLQSGIQKLLKMEERFHGNGCATHQRMIACIALPVGFLQTGRRYLVARALNFV